MTKLFDVKAVGEEIELARNEVHHIGPGTQLEKCTVRVRCEGRNLVIQESTFVACRIVADRLQDCPLTDVVFEDCIFEGTFQECDFGPNETGFEGNGRLGHCDFTRAVLDTCQFYNTDLAELALNADRAVVIGNPSTHESLLDARWPGRIRFLMEGIAESSNEVSFVVLDLPSLEVEYAIAGETVRQLLASVERKK